MRFVLFLAVLMFVGNAYAGEIRKLTPEDKSEPKATVGILNVASPSDVADAQQTENADLEYMMDNYSTEEMAQYAIQVSRAQRAAAVRNGQTPPPKLTQEQLRDKQQMRDYLRSLYNYVYE
jgi:hypothetical protein